MPIGSNARTASSAKSMNAVMRRGNLGVRRYSIESSGPPGQFHRSSTRTRRPVDVIVNVGNATMCAVTAVLIAAYRGWPF